MTNRLLTTFKQKIKDLKLIPSNNGCFEITVDGKLIYSKTETGEFPDEQKIVDAMST